MRENAIAIDGPSGAGKSTVAKLLADKLGYVYVDTGAMYRAIGLYVARNHVAHGDAETVAACLKNISLRVDRPDGTQHVYLNGEDVSESIRTEEASAWASEVSALPPVRSFLLEFQRDFARHNDVIMDGRDIGTVVLPHAGLKVFLTASDEIRAKRRFLEQVGKGYTGTYDDVLAAIRCRDEKDSTRVTAPLRAAEDAITVDCSAMTLEQTVNRIESMARERFPRDEMGI